MLTVWETKRDLKRQHLDALETLLFEKSPAFKSPGGIEDIIPLRPLANACVLLRAGQKNAPFVYVTAVTLKRKVNHHQNFSVFYVKYAPVIAFVLVSVDSGSSRGSLWIHLPPNGLQDRNLISFKRPLILGLISANSSLSLSGYYLSAISLWFPKNFASGFISSEINGKMGPP